MSVAVAAVSTGADDEAQICFRATDTREVVLRVSPVAMGQMAGQPTRPGATSTHCSNGSPHCHDGISMVQWQAVQWLVSSAPRVQPRPEQSEEGQHS